MEGTALVNREKSGPPAGALMKDTSPEAHVSTYSRPSDLRITDLRVANLVGVPF